MCTPRTPQRLGLVDGGRAGCGRRAGEIEAPVEVTDAVMQGVVSVPHGWGHDADGMRMTRGRRARGREQQRARRRDAARRRVRERRAERNPGRGGAGRPSRARSPAASIRRSCCTSRWRYPTSGRSWSASRSAGTRNAARSGAGSTRTGSDRPGCCYEATALRSLGTRARGRLAFRHAFPIVAWSVGSWPRR